MSSLRSVLVLAALVAVSVEGAGAQVAERTLEGRIARPLAGGRDAGVAGEWVVLHRVGADAAGPLDSMRTRADGRYAFRYRASGDSAAVYFVSTMRGGVAYFSPPTREPTVRGGMADLMVFDTTSAPLPIAVRSRSVIFTAPDSATGTRRAIIEVYEVANDTTLTRVTGNDGRPTFEAPLPEGVTAVTGGQGDVSPEAMRADDGVLRVYAPLPPGSKQFSFSYEIPASQLSLAVPIETNLAAVEVLVEDPRGIVSGADLVENDPVLIDGRPFKRFLGSDVQPPALIEITAPGAQDGLSSLRVMMIVTAIGAAMLLGLGMSVLRGGVPSFARRRVLNPESLALEIAALDAAFEQVETPSEEQRSEHYLKRMQLKGRLSAALAKRDGLA